MGPKLARKVGAVNTLEYAIIFMTALDEQFMLESTTSWMEANASQVHYNGGRKVKIPKITTTGMGDYDRDTGFPRGGVTLEWEERELTRDRGKEFILDSMDVNETNFVANAAMVMGDFQRQWVIPEVDSFRYSEIFQLANQKLRSGAYTPATGTIYDELKDNITAIQDVIGDNEPLVIAISNAAANVLDKSTDIEKHISVDDFANGALQTKVKSLDGIPMFRIPSARFKTDYTFATGVSTFGFAPSSVAMQINWIIMSRRAVIAIVKTDKPRIWTPEQNQDMDAWKIQYRKFHDLWVLDNKFPSIWVSYTAIAAPALSATVAQGAVSGTTKFTATKGTGNTLAYKKAGSAISANFNDVPTDLTAYVSGADITATASDFLGMYELDATGHVVKFLNADLASGDIKP
jgi:hypothetical protein